jgi:single-stranded-DNA-specific exonuclease
MLGRAVRSLPLVVLGLQQGSAIVVKHWQFRGFDRDAIQSLASQAGVETVVAQLLYQRGLTDPSTISSFLDARFSDLREPDALPNMSLASERILRAIRDKEPITIYGDYDADGMSGTAILMNCLRLLEADVQYYIPNRLEDSYGLNCEALEKLFQRGRRVIVSVDCGIGSISEAAYCRERGLELIVTDHHSIGDHLPEAHSIVHPGLPGFEYPFHGLCGAGVALKLAWALCQLTCANRKVNASLRQFLIESTCIAAIATVADVVPLLDENRIIVRNALKFMLQSAPPGLAALLRRTNLGQKSMLTAEDLAFSIAPRLNAAGRLGQAQLGVELLTTRDPERAAALAEYLDRLNSDRETLERSVSLAATKQIKEHFNADSDPAFVLAGAGWHLGVIGVVAGRIAEKFHRPVVVIGLDPVGQKPGTGSARSQGIVNLHEALLECREHLVSSGGHAAAAGLKVEERHLSAFRQAFLDVVERKLGGNKAVAKIEIDAEVTLKQINSLQLVHSIEKIAPFGANNPRPVLVASNVDLSEPAKTMGNGDRHFSARFVQHGTAMRAVAFGQAEWVQPINQRQGPIDIAFRPSINEFNGMQRVELQLLDWRNAKLSPNPPHTSKTSSSSIVAS